MATWLKRTFSIRKTLNLKVNKTFVGTSKKRKKASSSFLFLVVILSCKKVLHLSIFVSRDGNHLSFYSLSQSLSRSPSLLLSLSFSHTYTQKYTLFIYTRTLSLLQTHILSVTQTYSQSFFLSLFLTHLHSGTHYLSLFYTHTVSLFLCPSLPHSLFLSLSLSNSHSCRSDVAQRWSD